MPGIDFRSLGHVEWAEKPAPQVNYDFRVFFAESVFDHIALSADTEREMGGILVGDIYIDSGGPFVQVDAIIDALHAREKNTELTITYATWEHVHREMESAHVGKRIVGWYHTHPGFGVFLSEQDEFIHRNFFSQPDQIALVYDPVQREHGAFCWKEDKLWRLRNYWVGTSQHNWDGTRESKKVEETAPADDVFPATDAAPTTPSSSEAPADWPAMINTTTMIIALVVALVAGGLFGLQLGSQVSDINNRAQGAEDAIDSLNADLLYVLQAMTGDTSLDAVTSQVDADLQTLIDTLTPRVQDDPDMAAIILQLTETQQSLRTARSDQQITRELISRLEFAARGSSGENLTNLQQSVGNLYLLHAQNALNNGQFELARELLIIAIDIDPRHRALYVDLLEQLAEEEPSSEITPTPTDTGEPEED